MRITSCVLHVPSLPGRLHTTCVGPPAAEIFLSFPSAKNAMFLLSGDQNGLLASSVPGSGWAVEEPSGRVQSCVFPSTVAINTILLPSGERKFPSAPIIRPLSGEKTSKRTTRAWGGGEKKVRMANAPASKRDNAATATKAYSRRDEVLGMTGAAGAASLPA